MAETLETLKQRLIEKTEEIKNEKGDVVATAVTKVHIPTIEKIATKGIVTTIEEEIADPATGEITIKKMKKRIKKTYDDLLAEYIKEGIAR